MSSEKTEVNYEVRGFYINLGEKILNKKYQIQSKLESESSGEAQLYLCSDGKRSYIAKIYSQKRETKIVERLQKIDSPYVEKVYDVGEVNGKTCVVLPYYKRGSLEGNKFSTEQLKKEIIPKLNEGLKTIHDVDIIHADLKPSNIVCADNGDIVLIDFGISVIGENNAIISIDEKKKTSAYAAPEVFSGSIYGGSDYYSLGITILELYSGKNYYEGLSDKKIQQYKATSKVMLPDNMDKDLKILIRALTYSDITNRENREDPNRRWGYEEVKKWCDGIRQPVPGEARGRSVLLGDIEPYKFLDEIYTDRQKLVKALADHWEEGKKELFRGFLSKYFSKFDLQTERACMDAIEEKKKTEKDEDLDLIFFKVLYQMDSSMKRFIWKGRHYEDISMLGEDIWKRLNRKDFSLNSFIDELLRGGVLSKYVYYMGENAEGEDKMQYIQRKNVLEKLEMKYQEYQGDRDSRRRLVYYYFLAYRLSGKTVFCKNGREFKNVQQLAEYLKALLIKQNGYGEFEKICHELIKEDGNLDVQFESWLWALEKGQKLNQWKTKYFSNVI